MPSRSSGSGGWPAASATEVVGTPVAHGALEMTLEIDDPQASAEQAGLRYVSDTMPGIRRRRGGRGFSYVGTDGRRITDPDRIAWFKGLAIPPAWTDVWISPIKRGHIQATGRDARGRKQYRYHPRWREVRDEAKYGRMIEFARALPRIRRRTDRDLRRRGSAAREGAGARRPPPRGDAHPGRQRGVRTREPDLRPLHAARPSRQGRGRQRAVQLQGQSRERSTRFRSRTNGSRGS